MYIKKVLLLLQVQGRRLVSTAQISTFPSSPPPLFPMHRSGSTTRVSDEFYSGAVLQPATGRVSLPGASSSSSSGQRIVNDQLPKYNPQSELARKEANRSRSAENVVHIIPVVLILCGLVLWLFSSPHVGSLNNADPAILPENKNA